MERRALGLIDAGDDSGGVDERREPLEGSGQVNLNGSDEMAMDYQHALHTIIVKMGREFQGGVMGEFYPKACRGGPDKTGRALRMIWA